MNREVVPADIRDIRAFNRFYTSVMGFLDQGLLNSRFTLTEARVLFELAQHERVGVPQLRDRVRIDAGHLSRILGRFESAGFAVRSRSEDDGRRQVAELTDKGRHEFNALNIRSDEQARRLLEQLSEDDRRALLASLRTVRSVLGDTATSRTVVLRPLRPGDLGWVVHRHGVLYAEEYRWDQSFEALVARIVADYAEAQDREGQCAWIAEVDGRPAGSVFCMRRDSRTAQLRLLLVEPEARGLGIGGKLIDECVSFARAAGYESLSLWTNDVLTAARRLYERAGFKLEREDRHQSFRHDLIGQHWSVQL